MPMCRVSSFTPLCLLFLLVVGSSTCTSLHSQTRSGCGGNSTIADTDPSAVQPAEAFLARLQTAFKADDKPAIARLASYPLRVNSGRRHLTFRSQKGLLAQFDKVFTVKVRQAVLAQQSACLFANDLGMMIGDGEVWFNKNAKGEYLVSAINVR